MCGLRFARSLFLPLVNILRSLPYRGHARTYLKDLEKVRPSVIVDIIRSGEAMQIKETVKMPMLDTCSRCGFVSSNKLCKACVLLQGLNAGKPRFVTAAIAAIMVLNRLHLPPRLAISRTSDAMAAATDSCASGSDCSCQAPDVRGDVKRDFKSRLGMMETSDTLDF